MGRLVLIIVYCAFVAVMIRCAKVVSEDAAPTNSVRLRFVGLAALVGLATALFVLIMIQS
jgi:hypothetical protein